jgi:hypothetical protein
MPCDTAGIRAAEKKKLAVRRMGIAVITPEFVSFFPNTFNCYGT